MDYLQQQEVEDTRAVCEVMERAISLVKTIGEAQIKKYPRSEVSGVVQEFLDGMDDWKADTFKIAMKEVEQIESDLEDIEHTQMMIDLNREYHSNLGVA